MKSIVLTKGYMIIPKKIRRKFGIRKGTVIDFSEANGEIILTPVTQKWIESNTGFMNTNGKLLKALMKEKKLHREM